jgi:hypothetical protein
MREVAQIRYDLKLLILWGLRRFRIPRPRRFFECAKVRNRRHFDFVMRRHESWRWQFECKGVTMRLFNPTPRDACGAEFTSAPKLDVTALRLSRPLVAFFGKASGSN